MQSPLGRMLIYQGPHLQGFPEGFRVLWGQGGVDKNMNSVGHVITKLMLKFIYMRRSFPQHSGHNGRKGACLLLGMWPGKSIRPGQRHERRCPDTMSLPYAKYILPPSASKIKLRKLARIWDLHDRQLWDPCLAPDVLRDLGRT